MNGIEEENEIAHSFRGLSCLPAERRSDVRLPPLLQAGGAYYTALARRGPRVHGGGRRWVSCGRLGLLAGHQPGCHRLGHHPGTTVDSPILQAHGDAPGYYLKHDVYGNYNPAGAIYLDADCEELGLSSRNAVILGHHFWNDKKVAPMGTVADYKDVDFAREHSLVLIQTPNTKMTYEARFAQIVNGRERNQRIDFEGESDFRAWYGESLCERRHGARCRDGAGTGHLARHLLLQHLGR